MYVMPTMVVNVSFVIPYAERDSLSTHKLWTSDPSLNFGSRYYYFELFGLLIRE
jgi:hypothetical protein